MLIPSPSTVIPTVSAGGGAEYDPLAPPSAPAAQALASGTTSSSTISWGSPTGGSGSTTTADVLTQDVGTGASLSAGAVVGLEDGDVCRVTRTWTDSVTGQTVSRTTTVSVAAAAGGYDWALKDLQSFAGLDTAGPWSSGTNDITDDAGATTISTLTVTRSGSTNGTFEIDADGILATVSTGTGNTSGALDLDSMLGGTDQAWWEEGEVIIQAAYDLDAIGASSYFIAGLSPLTTQGTGFRGIYVPTAGTLVVYGYYDGTIGPTLHTGNFTSFRVTVRVWKGRYVTVGFTAGTKTLVAPESADAGSFIGQPAAASGSAPVFTTVANWLTNVKTAITGLRLCDIQINRLEAV
jgi:hypothetical protein